MRNLIVIFISILLSFQSSFSHRENPLKIVIDTDMGLDDIRALTLLLQSDHVDIQALILTEGVADINNASDYANRMLNHFERTDIPVYLGNELNNEQPSWRENLAILNWNLLPNSENIVPKSIDEFNLKSSKTVVYVALGPLTNLEYVIANTEYRDHIASVYFAGISDLEVKSFNTSFDKKSSQNVFNSQLPIYCFELKQYYLPVFNCEMVFNSQFDTKAHKLLNKLFGNTDVMEHLCGNHGLHAYDDAVALYLDEPYIGSFENVKSDYNLFEITEWNKEEAFLLYEEILSGEEMLLRERETVVLKDYPYDSELFREDVQAVVEKIIEKHGKEEWKAVLLTNELHRHLGIYSIIGAKMGVRAREILHSDLDEVKVESFAGLEPPLSCLNDGLQVSTGASLGRGTITILSEISPKANFIKSDKMLVMEIKQNIINSIKSDVQAAGKKYGFQSKEYFDEIRRLSFEYWLELDRNEIFNEFIYNIDKGTK